jgi:hypothetical protein
MNFKTEDYLGQWKEWIYEQKVTLVFLPLIVCFMIENKLNRHHNFGQLHALMSHGLSGMVAFYNYTLMFKRPSFSSSVHSITSNAAISEYQDELQMVGFATYLSTITAICISMIVFKGMQGKTWENISVRNGIYIAKAAMLVSGCSGPLLYTCLITQLYYFSIILNHRKDSRPGGTFVLHVFFTFFTAGQYFLRGNHRKSFNSV